MQYFVRQIDNQPDLEAAMHLRRQVFVEEQGVPAHEEYDQYEGSSFHYLAVDDQNRPCGTARWRFTDAGIKLERFAVDAYYRRQGVGAALVRTMLHDIDRHPDQAGRPRYLHAQVTAMPLYEQFGFCPEGDRFDECGIAHYKMRLATTSPAH